MKRHGCGYYRCKELCVKCFKQEKYCSFHLKLIKKLNRIVKKPKEGRVCAYSECNVILTVHNRSVFCFVHARKITFGAAGAEAPGKLSNIHDEESQWDKMIEKII